MISLRDGLMLGTEGIISLVGAGGKTSLMFKLAHELAKAGETVLTTTTTKIYVPKPEQSSQLILSGYVPLLLKKARASLKDHRHITAAAGELPDQEKLHGFAPEVIQDIWNGNVFRWIIVEADGAAGKPLKAPAAHEPAIPASTSQVVGVIGLNGAGQPLNEKWVFRLERFIHLSGLSYGSDITEAAIVAVLVHENGIFKHAPAAAARIAFCNQADLPQNRAAGQRLARTLIQRKKTGLTRVVIGQTLFDPPVLEVYDLRAESEYET